MNQFTVSLWGDEGWAAHLAIKPLWQVISLVAKDTSPPLYYIFLHTWLKIFGTSEIAIRSLSFIFFLATALTAYLIAKHLWNQKTGLLAGLLVLVNPFLFNYAFEGRMYALLVLTSTLSVYFFVKKNRLGFVLATTAALYMHHFAIFVVVWEGIWVTLTSFKDGWKAVFKQWLPFLYVGLLYLPWLYPLYYQTSLVSSGFWLGKPVPKDLPLTLGKFLIGSDAKEVLPKIALISLLAVLGLRRWQRDWQKTTFLIGWILTPLLLTYVLSQLFQSIFYDRYMLLVIPGLAILIASLGRRLSWLPLIVAVGSLLMINYHYFFNPTKRPFRELADFIKTEAPNLTLINHNAASHHIWESKYYGLNAPIYSPQPLPFYTGTALMVDDDVIEVLPDEPVIGVITSASVEEVSLPGYHQEGYHQIESLKFLWMAKD